MSGATAAIEELAQALGRTRAALFVTGAGVSLASGIDTFRGSDAGAVWKNDIMEKATLGYFRRDPVDAWAWYLARFERVAAAEPNPAHRALVALEDALEARGARSLLVTQNIDGLHHRAGSRALVEIHGKARKVRCASPRCPEGAFGTLEFEAGAFDAFRGAPSPEQLPRCPHCGDGLLRPHVLWFDEHYQSHPDYGFERVLAYLPTADLVLFVGTSFSVGITDWIVEDSRAAGRACWSIDPSGEAPPGVGSIAGQAEELLPTLVEA